MQCNPLKNLFVATVLASLSSSTFANPIVGHFIDDSRGQALPDQMLTNELGDATMFTISDALVYHDHRDSGPMAVPDDGIGNDWTVHIENVSGRWWRSLFFVADLGATIGNADGTVEDMAGAIGVMTDAFQIHTGGVNSSLISESMTADGLLEPGEELEFRVSNFGTGANSRPPQLTTPGVFAGSSPLDPFAGNSSILATPLPEPSSILLLMIAGVALLARRR